MSPIKQQQKDISALKALCHNQPPPLESKYPIPSRYQSQYEVISRFWKIVTKRYNLNNLQVTN